MKTMIALAALVAVSSPAFAGQPEDVKNMTDFLKANRGAASVASAVSGDGNGGWGNVGSKAVTGGQVSSRPTK